MLSSGDALNVSLFHSKQTAIFNMLTRSSGVDGLFLSFYRRDGDDSAKKKLKATKKVKGVRYAMNAGWGTDQLRSNEGTRKSDNHQSRKLMTSLLYLSLACRALMAKLEAGISLASDALARFILSNAFDDDSSKAMLDFSDNISVNASQ